MKASLTTDSIGRVTLSYDDFEGTRVSREFSCPPDGGYVIERRGNGEWKQVCERLDSMGVTLMASSRDELPDVIRKAYKAMRNDQKRYAAA
jgi:hypothetical protein